MREIVIPLGLVALGLVLIGCETFVPSAGILGILASISLISGVSLAYYYGGIVSGTLFMVLTFVIVAIVIHQMIRWWPHTSIGKSILIETPPVPDQAKPEFHSLIGQVGKSLGTMMPGGYVEVEGKRYDAVADVAVNDGQFITVTGLDGHRTLRVRPISADVAAQLQSEQTPVDPLTKPAHDVVEDPFRDG